MAEARQSFQRTARKSKLDQKLLQHQNLRNNSFWAKSRSQRTQGTCLAACMAEKQVYMMWWIWMRVKFRAKSPAVSQEKVTNLKTLPVL